MSTFFLIGCDNSVDNDVQNQINEMDTKIVNDSIIQYNMTKSGGNKIDICVQAGMVKAAMLYTKNDSGYKQWNAIEKTDCAAAGIVK